MSVMVYGIPGSPYVRAVLLGCEEKGVPYDFQHMQMGETKSPEHLARHPFGRIPAFEHNGFAFYETQAILRYIDVVFPGPALQPEEPRAAARMNQLAGICDWYFFPQVSATIGFQRLIKPLMGGSADEDVCAEALPNATRCVTEIARLLGDGPYLAGAQLSIAVPLRIDMTTAEFIRHAERYIAESDDPELEAVIPVASLRDVEDLPMPRYMRPLLEFVLAKA